MSVPKKKPEHKTSPWPRVPTKPKYAPHDGPLFEPDSNPFPVPIDTTPSRFPPRPPHHPTPGHYYAKVEDIAEYPMSSILGMGPEGALQAAARKGGKGGKTTLTGSGGGK